MVHILFTILNNKEPSVFYEDKLLIQVYQLNHIIFINIQDQYK